MPAERSTAEILSVRAVHGGWSRLSLATVRLADGAVVARETIEVVETPPTELARPADAGELIDRKTLAVRARHPRLFSG